MSRIVLLVAYFLDFFCFSLIIPLLAPLVFEYAGGMKYLVLGFLLAAYPAAQIFGNPFLGHLADRIGRKKILFLSYLGNCAGYLFSLMAIFTHQLVFLFIGHLISGLLGANMSMTNAIISDHSCEKKQRRLFSLTHLLIGITFVVSPLISGKLFTLTHSIDKIALITFSVSTLISLFNLLLISRYLQENPSLPPPLNLKQILSVKGLRTALMGTFCFYFGWYGFIKFFQAYLLEHLHFSYEAFCGVLSILGFTSVAIQSLHTFIFSKRFPFEPTLNFSLASLGIFILVLLIFDAHVIVYLITPLIAAAHSLGAPSLTYYVSRTTKSGQGKVMTLFQASQGTAKMLSPITMGLMMTFSMKSPLLLSAFFVLLTPLILFRRPLRDVVK
ncbi:MAG: hypothetical protein SP1CHLAM54_05510 [Chlamydiia bacterium]|nr:hypothetical protein [Chlamydiia bacterium]MCH9615461.1 hypothetical protein [Chlamydiia bacterium]MCH9629116.1 hypothetical protein [Chlamydiia bacterium]